MPLLPPSLPRVTVADSTMAGDELRGAAEAVAERIAGAAVVAVEATATLETVTAVVGCLLAGVPLVPLPPDAGPRERDHLLTDFGAELVLGRDVPIDLAARSSRAWTEPADGAALFMYTSGTTGAPKGAVISRRAIAACLDGLADAWQWSDADTLVHGLPLFHVHGLVLGVLGALRTGSPLVHTGKPTPAAYAAAVGTLYFGVPTVWSRVAADPAAMTALRSARLLVSGSAALPAPVFARLVDGAGQGPVERYGMTETLITLAARADAPRHPGRVGVPLPGVDVRLDRRGDDGIGELRVRGATLFDGYLGRPAALDEDGWFDTGDSARETDEGWQLVGRTRDDLIKTGGYRVGAGEVEAVLLERPDVEECAVVGVADDDLGQRIVAYVVSSSASAQILIDHVASELNAHKRPREIRFVDALPRNAMGKIQKSRLS